MAESETWEDRYKRAVLTYAGAPADVDLSTATINVSGEDGYNYSSWTFASPDIGVYVEWQVDGQRHSKDIDGPEAVADLIRSFLSA